MPCRIEWRPSRLVGAISWGLAVLAPFSLLASGLPRLLAWPLALLALAWGVREARAYLRRPALALLIPPGRGPASCNGQPVAALRLHWRGPLAFLRWRDGQGRSHRASWWPDTLDAATRRELRLAMQRRDAAPGQASVAG